MFNQRLVAIWEAVEDLHDPLRGEKTVCGVVCVEEPARAVLRAMETTPKSPTAIVPFEIATSDAQDIVGGRDREKLQPRPRRRQLPGMQSVQAVS